MVPTLLVVCFMQRAITFQVSTKSSFAFDFTSTIAKFKAADASEPYDLFKDKDQLRVFMGELLSKGLIAPEYQTLFFNFIILWYFLSSFIV